jgi:hypothetical protein
LEWSSCLVMQHWVSYVGQWGVGLAKLKQTFSVLSASSRLPHIFYNRHSDLFWVFITAANKFQDFYILLLLLNENKESYKLLVIWFSPKVIHIGKEQCWTGIGFFCYYLDIYNEDFILFDGYGYGFFMVFFFFDFIWVCISCKNFHI